MTALQKIIHAQVTKGQISITEKTRGEKRLAPPRRRRTGRVSRSPEPKIEAPKRPFGRSWPSAIPAADTPAGAEGAGELGAPLAGRRRGQARLPCQGHWAGAVSRGTVATRTLERRNILILSGHLMARLLVSAPPALPPAHQAWRGPDRTSRPSCELGSLTCHGRAGKRTPALRRATPSPEPVSQFPLSQHTALNRLTNTSCENEDSKPRILQVSQPKEIRLFTHPASRRHAPHAPSFPGRSPLRQPDLCGSLPSPKPWAWGDARPNTPTRCKREIEAKLVSPSAEPRFIFQFRR